MTAGRIEQLTEAQRACLRLVLTHHNSKEIAARFNVSPSAIDKRIERAVQVLGVGTRFEAARHLQEHEQGAPRDTVLDREVGRAAASIPTYERLPSEPIDVPIPPSNTTDIAQIEPWGLVRRFFGVVEGSGSTGVARNRSSIGDRVIRLIALMGLIAVTSMALVNLAMTMTSLLRSNRDRGVPAHGTATMVPTGENDDAETTTRRDR